MLERRVAANLVCSPSTAQAAEDRHTGLSTKLSFTHLLRWTQTRYAIRFDVTLSLPLIKQEANLIDRVEEDTETGNFSA